MATTAAETNPVAARQARFNRSTQEHWPHFAAHRERIEQLLIADGLGGGGRLCVLGAGNCNDLNLPRLVETFQEIHLVDLDPAALGSAIRRQGVESGSRVNLHAPVDLSAVADRMAGWAAQPVPIAEVDDCIRRAAAAPPPALGGPFSVVLSPCVLSQIMGYASDALGANHPRVPALRRALRDRHLRLLADAVEPGGWGILITDIASSARVLDLPRSRHKDLPDLLPRLVGFGKTYPDLDPASVCDALYRGPAIAPSLAEVRTLHPWLWTLGPLKTFLVYAIRLRKAKLPLLRPHG